MNVVYSPTAWDAIDNWRWCAAHCPRERRTDRLGLSYTFNAGIHALGCKWGESDRRE